MIDLITHRLKSYLTRDYYARLGRSRRVADVAEREENKARVRRILKGKKDD